MMVGKRLIKSEMNSDDGFNDRYCQYPAHPAKQQILLHEPICNMTGSGLENRSLNVHVQNEIVVRGI